MVSFNVTNCLFWSTCLVQNSPELALFRLKYPKPAKDLGLCLRTLGSSQHPTDPFIGNALCMLSKQWPAYIFSNSFKIIKKHIKLGQWNLTFSIMFPACIIKKHLNYLILLKKTAHFISLFTNFLNTKNIW